MFFIKLILTVLSIVAIYFFLNLFWIALGNCENKFVKSLLQSNMVLGAVVAVFGGIFQSVFIVGLGVLIAVFWHDPIED